ncbi:MAG TPA: histidinol dehydrogenase [Cyclobacteriaceae bacterium]|nr:histidinol dehydrogenase [Cyclobacteriaceae bacterium]
MKQYLNPEKSSWATLCQRPVLNNDYLNSTVNNIIQRVKIGGDKALKTLTTEFDKVEIDSLELDKKSWQNTADKLDASLKLAIQHAGANIEKFHAAQQRTFEKIETTSGVFCWRKAVAIEKVGIYIPGGTAPLFSTVLMLAIPARLAGCKEIILCSPPDAKGNVNPAIMFAAQLAGVSRAFKVGGAQAIAAMAYGTESIPAVDKIFGPGNQYVTKAKQLVNLSGVAIDMPAGPSEVLILCDETADASFVAADLLSQAEHGADSQVMLLSTNENKVKAIVNQVEEQLNKLPRKEFALQALAHSRAICFDKQAEAVAFSNLYAPEHLIINMKDAEQVAEQIINAGSVFIGQYTPESAGDYASGTNHTLPTNGTARAYSGVSLESFQKFITFQQLSEQGIKNLGNTVMQMAKAEQLEAHSRAVEIRLQKLQS